MKKKMIAATIALTAISSIYAAQGKGYREYGEKIYSSPGSNFHVEEAPSGTTLAQKKKYYKWQNKHKCTKQKWSG